MSMVVDYGTNFGSGLVYGTMNRPLAIHRPSALVDWVAVEVELHQIVERDQFRAARSRKEKAVRALWMPYADVAKGIDHLFVRENSVGSHEVAESVLQVTHGSLSKR